MNRLTRIAIAAFCFSLCAAAAIVANVAREQIDPENAGTIFGADLASSYQFAASGAQPQLTFPQVEAIIRSDRIAKTHPGRMEFGSVKRTNNIATVEVAFLARDGRIASFIYTLTAANRSWKIENVQRLWFVPRSHFLRGLQV